MDVDFEKWTVKKLQAFLRDRGVTITGYVKKELVELCLCVARLRLPVDPNFSDDSLQETLDARLRDAGCSFSDPFKLVGFSTDFSNIPEFGLYDVFNYLICFRADYDRRKLRAYKSFEDYRLFSDGHVLALEYNDVDKSSPVCVFKGEVKPTQKDKTYLNKDTYNLWIIVHKESADVKAAYCECQGGSDGACRHIAAVLFEVEAFEKKSVTDGPSQWVRRARDLDQAAPLQQLRIKSAKYGDFPENIHKKRPLPDVFDPRHPDDRGPLTVDQQEDFVKRLRQIEPECGVIELLSHDIIQEPPRYTLNSKCVDISFLNIAKQLLENTGGGAEEILNTIQLSEEQINYIYESTIGQNTNPTWKEMRKGILTASNFKRVYTRMRTLEKDPHASPAALLELLMGEKPINGTSIPAPLKWGQDNEAEARAMYFQVEKKKHKQLHINEAGLLVEKDTPYLGCSADGVVTCSCPGHRKRLIEIKCPYALRDGTPKDAAKERGCIKQNGSWILKQSSNYYTQIQGQLGISKFQKCDLVIYTRRGIHVIPVEFNEEFFQDLKQRLVLFYSKYMFPALLAKWAGN